MRPSVSFALCACAALCALAGASDSSGNLKQNSNFLGPGGPISTAYTFKAPVTGENLNDPEVDTYGNLVVSLSRGTVYAFNGRSGSQMWMYTYFSTSGAGLGDPVSSRFGRVVVPTLHGALALDSLTGNLAWTFTDGLTTSMPSTVVLDPNMAQVYIGGRGTPASSSIYCFNVISGVQLWLATTDGGTASLLATSSSVLVGYPGVFATGGSLSVAAINSLTGSQQWYKLPVSQALVEMFFFQLDQNGNVWVGYSTNGASLLQRYVPSSNGAIDVTINIPTTNTYACLGVQNIYVGNTLGTSAYSLATGAQQWTSTVALSPISEPVMAAQGNYFILVTGGLKTVSLAALDATTGNTVWSFVDPDSQGVFGYPVFDAAGTMYIESFSSAGGSTAYAINPATGNAYWTYHLNASATVYYDTQLALGNGMVFLGDDTKVVAITHSAPSSNAGRIAGAVIGSLIGVGAAAAGVWYFVKYRRARAGYSDVGTGYSYSSTTV